jgi:UDP-N-acetylglucosamine--N-acetylmuramyl-(pentapeptide) pyrophosphoryl-undecaprenol N-acetylglucosamine transferase
MKNAREMADRGAAIIIENDELTGRTMFETVVPLMRDESRRREIGEKAREMYNPECLDIIFNEIMDFISKGK